MGLLGDDLGYCRHFCSILWYQCQQEKEFSWLTELGLSDFTFGMAGLITPQTTSLQLNSCECASYEGPVNR